MYQYLTNLYQISHVSVYYGTDFLLKFFGTFLDTPAVSEYVCGTMQASF